MTSPTYGLNFALADICRKFQRFKGGFVVVLFAACVSAQEHIQVQTELVFRDERKYIDVTITNKSDEDMLILCSGLSPDKNSRFNVVFLDNNDQVVSQSAGDIYNDLESKMYIIKPHSNEHLKIIDEWALGDLRKRYPERCNSIRKFKVEFYIRYILPSSGFFEYKKTTELMTY